MKLGWKIILIILALLVGGFLAQIGIDVYKIKTGKIISSYNFTAAKKISGTPDINATEILNSKAPYFGSISPQLTVVEFGNFDCPHCKEESATAREMMIKYKDKMKFIYRDYPMDDIFPNSSELALAGKCAAAENNILFWAMYERLYGAADPEQLSADNLSSLASQIGLNKNKFSVCLTRQTYSSDLNRDLYEGYKNGVAGTPTFFFIKKGLEDRPLKVEGAIPKETFQQIVDNLLK